MKSTDGECPNIDELLSSYRPADDDYARTMVVDVIDWLSRAKSKQKYEIAQQELIRRISRMEADILAHFREYVGGPGYITVDDAWALACRQREFVRECCARMAEGPGGEINNLSEAIRDIDISENVRVIPDYSRRIPIPPTLGRR